MTQTAIASSELVSVIIPAYNRAHLIARTLRSVRAQTWRPLEVLVVDDGSSDDTLGVVEDFGRAWAERAFQIRGWRQPHRGVSAARNAGLAEASGAYIQFLDSDDELMPAKVTDQVAALVHTGADYAVGVTEFVDREGRVTARTCPAEPPRPGERLRSYFAEPLWHVNSVLYRSEVCRALPPWELGLIGGEDQVYACRLKLSPFRGVVLDGVSDRVHDHGAGSATYPSDTASLIRYAQTFGVACERMYADLSAAEHATPVERLRLARYALTNAVRLSRAGDPGAVRAALRQAAAFAPWYARPPLLGLRVVAAASPGGLYRLWRGFNRLRGGHAG